MCNYLLKLTVFRNTKIKLKDLFLTDALGHGTVLHNLITYSTCFIWRPLEDARIEPRTVVGFPSSNSRIDYILIHKKVTSHPQLDTMHAH